MSAITQQLMSYGGVTDPFFSSVSLLLHGNGANGGTTFTDSSSSPKTVTRTGTATTSTTQSKFNGSSINLPGNGQITTPNVAGLELMNTDFTMEGWFYFTSTGSSTVVISKRQFGTTSASFQLHYYSGGWEFQYSGVATTLSLGAAPSLNAWHFVALSRNGTNLRLFIDGTQNGSTGTMNNSTENTAADFTIGGPVENNSYMTGYFAEFRVTKGVGRYTANFTPPTAPFPNS